MKPSTFSQKFKDQLSRNISVVFPPQRIVSLVPSQTELLFDLGLNEEVVGITKFCVHPAHQFKTKSKVGGTKNINLEKIIALNPDLIIANKEENDELQIKELSARFPVWISDIKSLQDAFRMITAIGEMVNRSEAALRLIQNIDSAFAKADNLHPQFSAAYLIWRKPYMAAGSDTFINSMMELAGFKNVLAHQLRYPEINVMQLKSLQPQFVLLSSEPYPFSDKHVQELEKELPGTKVLLVDGELFSWYGSRLLKAADYFREIRNHLQS
ncbi:MAG: ABC transporter substrate-binding protein [Chitinophagaceae bacterium]|nr:ABC transporter substrate-binding protein [Chitinophagaceae bacterium]